MNVAINFANNYKTVTLLTDYHMKMLRLIASLLFALCTILPCYAMEYTDSFSIHAIGKLPNGNWYLYPVGNPNEVSEGKIVKEPTYKYTFVTPKVILGYHDTPVITGNYKKLSAVLRSGKTKVIVRVPEKCKDAKFIEMIESKLAALGLNVLDHNLAEGEMSPAVIRRKSGADLLLDVSWLKFSDPEMFTSIDPETTKMDGNFEVKNKVRVYVYDDKKDLERHLARSKKKGRWYGGGKEPNRRYDILSDYNYRQDELRSLLEQELVNDRCFNTNKNVISAIFKFVNLADGTILNYYHLGWHEKQQTMSKAELSLDYVSYHIPGLGNRHGRYLPNPDNGDVTAFDRERYYDYVGPSSVAMACSYISASLNNGEIPFAKQLNDFQDVKIGDEQVVENTRGRSSSRGSSYGSGRTNYYRYFNSSYYSGSSRSNTNYSSSTVTTHKDAEWLRCSDFYGYYTPLTDKLVEELKKLL